MRLLLLHPGVAARSCADCVAWVHDDSGGRFGLPMLRAEKPVPRPAGTRPPCAACPKIPAGAEPRPENAVELSPKNRAAYLHYLECRAVGEFPADGIVRRNAALIRGVEDQAAAQVQARAAGDALAAGVARAVAGLR